MEKLRFAVLIRVSTERQAAQGESLKTQRKQCDEAVEKLGGIIYRYYSGQEHATVNEERAILDAMMRDAESDLWDAAMVADVTRWSRDNKRSKQDLERLRTLGKRFFVGTSEYDLNRPEHSLFIGLNAEIGEFFGLEQARKSILGKIELAKQGLPSCGNLPYGRTFDKETKQWGVIPETKALVEQMARTYLEENISYQGLQERFGLGYTYIHKIFRGAGDTWVQSFKSPRLGISETVPTKVPLLLPEEVIERIRTKGKTRQKYIRGGFKQNNYLLNRMLIEGETGYGLTGTSKATSGRYYGVCKKTSAGWYHIRADDLERTIVHSLFENLMQRDNFRETVFNGNGSNSTVYDDLVEKKDSLQKEIRKVEQQTSRLVKQLMKDEEGLFQETVEKESKRLNEKHKRLKFELESAENTLRTYPTEQEADAAHENLIKLMNQARFTSSGGFFSMPFEYQKGFLEAIFAGVDPQGKRYGIYIYREGKKNFRWEAYGRLGTMEGWVESKFAEPVYGVRSEIEDKETMGKIAEVINENIDKSSFATVFTTGTTLVECSKTLNKAGAAEVHAVTVTRALPEMRVDLEGPGKPLEL